MVGGSKQIWLPTILKSLVCDNMRGVLVCDTKFSSNNSLRLSHVIKQPQTLVQNDFILSIDISDMVEGSTPT